MVSLRLVTHCLLLLALLASTVACNRSHSNSSPASAPRDCSSCPELVAIPAGHFVMGDAAEADPPTALPRHDVAIRPFLLGRYEVTFDEWAICVRDGQCSGEIENEGWGTGRHPVMNVGWDDAEAYVRWLSKKTGARYRLPTEAEWEYAARAGSGLPYSSGATLLPGFAICWTQPGEDPNRTEVVGRTKPNAFGVFDLHGNVYEWVEDCWNETYVGAPTDGSAWLAGDCERHGIRGGSWNNLPGDLRSGARLPAPHGIRYNTLGFRVARDW